MKHTRRNSVLTFGLYLNAAILAAVLLVLIGREGPVTLALPAVGQNVPSSAGNGEVMVVSGQLAPNAWGIYLVDTGAGTLSVYQFQQMGNDRQLRLMAARDIRHDRSLGNFNTVPAPQEVAELVRKEEESGRVIREDRQEGDRQ